uniref:Putative ATPase domain containing protein n=1 Tax=viral metagenome TaxID=1070528 RepID=A0A6M3KQ16_9ZZZZ
MDTMTNSSNGNRGNIVVNTQPNSTPVPIDWAALGAVTGYNPREAKDLRLWIVGPSGEGKTTFISSIPDHVILDFDDGANGIPNGRAIRIRICDYKHYIAVTDKLIDEAKRKTWRMGHRVSFDTVDEWVDLIQSRLETEKDVPDITEFGSRGHGWALIKGRCWSRLKALEQAGYTWSCIGHMTSKTETNPVDHKERTVLRESVFPSFAKKITTKSDFKLTIYSLSQTVEKKEKRKMGDGRIIEVPGGTETVNTYYADSFTTAAREGKSRAVPAMDRKIEIPLVGGWDVFAEHYNNAVRIEKEKKHFLKG